MNFSNFLPGTKVKATKVFQFGNSALSAGGVIKSSLRNSPQIGNQIFFLDGTQTSVIHEMKETEDGDLIIKTKTSIYLLQREKNQI
jgi:hypothetical protein